MTPFAVFATDRTPLYAFFAPITALLWARIGKREPLVMLVGAPHEWTDPDSSLVHRGLLEAIEREGGQVHHLAPFLGWKDSAVAQISRLFAQWLPGVQPDDELLTSDVDMWPLAPWPAEQNASLATVTRPGGWGLYSICYLQARVSCWRDIILPGTTSLEDGLGRMSTLIHGNHPGWSHDEWLSTREFTRWGAEHPGKLVVVERPNNCSGTRLDRDGWPLAPTSLEGYKDAHVLRPGWTNATWPRLRWVLQAFLGPEDLAWVEDYRASYAALMGT